MVFFKFKSVNAMNRFIYSSGDHTKKFIDWLTPSAKILSAKYRIPHRAVIAQIALETGWGKSSLLTKYNNFGGIKGSSVNMQTKEYINGQMVTITDGFASWPTPYEGLEGYYKLLTNKRYGHAVGTIDPYDYIEKVYNSGYATDPNYMKKIGQILKKYVV